MWQVKRSSSLACLLLGALVLVSGCGKKGADGDGSADGTQQASNEALALEAFQSGVKFAEAGLADRAIGEYQQAIRLDPSQGVFYLAMGDLYQKLYYPQQARAIYLQGMQQAPDFAPLPAMLAALEVQAKRVDDAVGLLRHSLKLDEAQADVHAKLGRALSYLSDTKGGERVTDVERLDEAIAELERAVELRPMRGEYHYWLGRVLEKRGNAERAFAEYQRAVEVTPDDIEYQLRLIDRLIGRGETEEAAAALEVAGQLDADNPIVHYHQGALAERAEDLEAARSAYQRCIELDPTAIKAYGRLASVLEALGEQDAAAQVMEEFDYWNQIRVDREYWLAETKLDPNNVEAHSKLGEALYMMMQPYEAMAHLQLALSLDSENGLANTFLGIIYQDLGESQVARPYLEKAVSLGWDGPEIQRSLAHALMGVQDHEAALGVLERIVELVPDERELSYNLGVVCLELGRSEEAKGHFARALELDPDYSEARFALATACFNLEEWERAAELFREIVASEPENQDAKDNLEMALRRGEK